MEKRICLPLLVCLFWLVQSGCYQRQNKQVALTGANHRLAIEKGLNFLLKEQNPNGSWGKIHGPDAYMFDFYMETVASYDGLKHTCSALGCMAVLEAEEAGFDCGDALQKGIDYLLSLEPTRRAHPEELASVWGNDYVPRALIRCLPHCDRLGIPEKTLREKIDDWIAGLRRHQSMDGGWGYYDFGYGTQHPSGFESTSFLTGSVLVTLKEAKDAGISLPQSMIPLAVRSAQRLRQPDGSYIYGNYALQYPAWDFNRVKGSLARCHAPNAGLFMHGGGVREKDLLRGLDNLIQNHHFLEIAKGRTIPHETWYSNAPYYYYFGHYYAAESIKLLPKEKRARYWKPMTQWMLNDQQKDGSWWDWRVVGFRKEWGTSYALMILLGAYQDEILHPN